MNDYPNASEPTIPETAPTAFQRKDLAVRKYAAVLGYMQYESNIYWVRAQHFLVASALLAGLALPRLPTDLHEITIARTGVLIAVSLAGILLSWLWLQALAAGDYWISHWKDALVALEQDAYGELLLHREFPRKPNYIPAKLVAKRTAMLFGVLWTLSVTYCLTALVYYIVRCPGG